MEINKTKKIIISVVLASTLLIFIFLPKKPSQNELSDEIQIIDTIATKQIIYKYEIPLDDYNIDQGIVKRNQSLSHILGNQGMSAAQIYSLANKSKDIFDVRQIKQGNNYTLFKTKDSIAQLDFFVYEIDAKSYVTFDLRNDFKITKAEKPSSWEDKELSGEIKSSLWVAMTDQGAE